jgi:hypothetical protein
MIKPMVDNGSADIAIATRNVLSQQVIYGAPISTDSENRASVRSIGKYHRLKVDVTGLNWESVVGLDVEINSLGTR